MEKCDFKDMFEYFEVQKEKKKSMTKDEKKAYVMPADRHADIKHKGGQGQA